MTKSQIERYLKGECSSQEAELIEKYLNEKDSRLEDILPETEWMYADQNSPYRNQEQIQQIINEKISKRSIILKQRKRKRIYALGACACALLIYGLIYLYHVKPVLKSQVEYTQSSPSEENIKSVNLSNLFYINSSNQDMELYTSDSSKIILSPGSEIRFAENFAPLKQRKIDLKGKAVFHVTRDTSRPFKVYSKNTVTTALGTTFLVDQSKGNVTRVKLIEGKIKVQDRTKHVGKSIDRVYINKGELLINHNKGHILKEIKENKTVIDRQGFYQEKDRKIIIKNLAVLDILSILSQNYKIELINTTGISEHYYFSGSFEITPEVCREIIKEINYLHKTNIKILTNNQ